MTPGTAALERALRGIEQGRRLPVRRLPDMEKRQSVQQISDLSRHLTDTELERFASTVEPRERALGLARSGKVVEARALLQTAHTLVKAGSLPEEGAVCARSFQAAAEALLDFLDGRLEEARAGLIEALVLCRRLRTEHGHRVEVRRVHLARNMVRVMTALGNGARAWAWCGELLEYVWASESRWPLGPDSALEPVQRERLREDERIFLTDQILSEAISTACDAAPLSQLPVWCTTLIPDAAARAADQIGRIGSDFAARRDPWLEGIAVYCANGPGELPMTWHRLERLVAARVDDSAHTGE